jgi:thioredoxin 1
MWNPSGADCIVLRAEEEIRRVGLGRHHRRKGVEKLAAKNLFTATQENFDLEILNYEGLVLVDFWAPWCAPCMVVGPMVEEIASDNAGKMKVAKLNVDENQPLALQYGIRGIPSLLFFKNGEPVDMIVGAAAKENIQEKIDGLL